MDGKLLPSDREVDQHIRIAKRFFWGLANDPGNEAVPLTQAAMMAVAYLAHYLARQQEQGLSEEP